MTCIGTINNGSWNVEERKNSQGTSHDEGVYHWLGVYSRGQTYTTNRGYFWHFTEKMFIQEDIRGCVGLFPSLT